MNTKEKLTDAAVPPFKASRACASVVIYTIYACSIVYTRVRITVIFVWKKAKNPEVIKTTFTGLAEKHIRPNNISKTSTLTDDK